jgi:hypothetical protein
MQTKYKRIKVTVTTNDITMGTPKSIRFCPIARAMKRVVGDDPTVVSGDMFDEGIEYTNKQGKKMVLARSHKGVTDFINTRLRRKGLLTWTKKV